MIAAYDIPTEVAHEIVTTALAMKNAERDGQYVVGGTHFFRLLDLLYPLTKPLAPVVSIESLAPDA